MADPALEVRKYVKDMSDVSTFLSYIQRPRAFPSLYSPAYLKWKISDNPFGPSASFLRTRDGCSAAHCSITAKPANRSLLGSVTLAELGDTHTHPDFQRQGHFGVLGRHTIDDFGRCSHGASLIYGLPNANALPGWLRHCGCQIFEPMRLREMRRPAWRQALSRFPRIDNSVRLERVTDPDAAAAQIDALWPRVSSGGWLVEKTAAWWRWRYLSSTQHYDTYYIRANGEVAGWMVTHRTPASLPLAGRTAICDIVAVAPEFERSALRSLLRQVLGPLEVVMLWTQRGSLVDRAAELEGFECVREVPVIFANNDGWGALEAANVVPRLALGDTDNI